MTDNIKKEKFIYQNRWITYKMASDALLRRIEGLHTTATLAEELGLTRQATINLASKLKKEGHLTSTGGGKQVRFYKITTTTQRPRDPGMFDILNKHSPNMKLAPWYDHQVHGRYTVEDALIDAIETKSFRVLLVSLRLFNHITDWPRLYKLAKDNNCWQEVGALHDVSKLFFRVRKMPEKYRKNSDFKKKVLIMKYPRKDELFSDIEKYWKVEIPFLRGDIGKVLG